MKVNHSCFQNDHRFRTLDLRISNTDAHTWAKCFAFSHAFSSIPHMRQYLQYPSSPRQLITGFACFVAVILFDTAFL